MSRVFHPLRHPCSPWYVQFIYLMGEVRVFIPDYTYPLTQHRVNNIHNDFVIVIQKNIKAVDSCNSQRHVP